MTSSQTEHYGNAVSLLEQLHANFPEATAEGEDWVEAEKDYIELLVDLKTKVRGGHCVCVCVCVCLCEGVHRAISRSEDEGEGRTLCVCVCVCL